MGAPFGTIIKFVEAREMIEVEPEEYIDGDAFYAAEVYKWDGRRTTLVKQSPDILGWFEKMDWQ